MSNKTSPTRRVEVYATDEDGGIFSTIPEDT